MTIKAIFDKVSAFNDVASVTGLEYRARVSFYDFPNRDEFGTLQMFREFIRDEYLENAADAILECKDYKPDGTPATLTVKDWTGSHEFEASLEIILTRQW